MHRFPRPGNRLEAGGSSGGVPLLAFDNNTAYGLNRLMSASQLIEMTCLFLIASIAFIGGALQMYLGQPDTSPRLDNVHRFLAGIYFSTGLISSWAAMTVRQQGTLIYLLAFGVLMGGIGRLISIRKVGLPQPARVWLGYLILELLLPFVLAGAHLVQ
jgi:hypothetical protein